MVAMKAGSVETYLRNPDDRHTIALVFGPDRGLVAERCERLRDHVLKGNDDPFALIKLDGEAVSSDPGRLIDEATTISMFGGNRLIWVRDAGAKPMDNSLKPLLDSSPDGAFVLLQAGDLKPSSGLRKKIEACDHAVSLPCYADGNRDLDTVIDKVLSEFDLTIDPDARKTLKSLLGGDRLASRGEIEKLCLFCSGSESIKTDDVIEIVGDVSELNASAVLDAAFSGQIRQLETEYRRLIASGSNGSSVLSQGIRHGQMLQLARSSVDGGKPVSAAVKSMRPPVFYQRQDVVSRQIDIWSASQLSAALSQMDDALLAIRKNAGLEKTLPHRTLLWIARSAITQRR